MRALIPILLTLLLLPGVGAGGFVAESPGAVADALGGGIGDRVPDTDRHTDQNHGVSQGALHGGPQSGPGGHVLPPKPQAGQRRQHHRRRQLRPKERIAESYLPVDFHKCTSISFPYMD